jgi:signal peptidase I
MNNNENLNLNEAEQPINEKPADKAKKKNSFLGELFEYFELFVFSACAVLILFSFATRICRVDGPSMLKTLHDSEMLLVSDIFYTPEYGDIVVFHQTGNDPGDLNEPIVKRVIATENEWIEIDKNTDGTLTIKIYDENCENPIVLDEIYANYDNGFGYYNYPEGPIQVPHGTVFVMGDNRGNSLDSRSPAIGFVNQRRILGKVICRVTPLDKFGKVD